MIHLINAVSTVVDASLLDYLHDPELLIRSLLNAYGPWMVAVVALIVFIESGVLFPVLPGDSLIFALGIFHKEILVPMWLTFIVLVVAAIGGNIVGYWLGHRFGRRLFKPDARWLSTENLHKAEQFFEKYGGRSLVLARFVPFVRTFVPIVSGIAAYRLRPFLTWNIIGAAAWIAIFLVSGEFLGSFPFITDNISLIALLIIGVSLLPMLVEYIRNKGNKDESDNDETTPAQEQVTR